MNIVDKWLLKAKNDLSAASFLLEKEDLLTDVICFHCQQCVEKSLKAYLTYKREKINKTHDLAVLL